MPSSSKQNKPPLEQQCLEHNTRAKWECGHCGKPICKTCKPIALNFQVYHRDCVEKARRILEKRADDQNEIEAPSLGLKILAWCFFIGGVLILGLALFLLGLSLFSKAVPIRALMTSTLPTSLDSIPGSRILLNWIGGFSVLMGVVISMIGMGLLNCVAAARYAVLTLAWLEIVLAAFGWLVVLLLGDGFWDIPILGSFLVWYFMRRSVRKQFEKVL
jgi:hypothetical protein